MLRIGIFFCCIIIITIGTTWYIQRVDQHSPLNFAEGTPLLDIFHTIAERYVAINNRRDITAFRQISHPGCPPASVTDTAIQAYFTQNGALPTVRYVSSIKINPQLFIHQVYSRMPVTPERALVIETEGTPKKHTLYVRHDEEGNWYIIPCTGTTAAASPYAGK